MEIKDIANQLRKAGINARPKSLHTIMKAIEEVEEAIAQKGMNGDADMELEDVNGLLKSNDVNTESTSKRVLQHFIRRFKELNNCGGNTNDNILELITANQIYQSMTLEDLESTAESKNISEEEKKNFKSMIQSTSDKIYEDKVKQIEDPNFEVIEREVIVLDSFRDIPQQLLINNK